MSLEAFILGAVQGLAEFLPISSSAHLILIHKFFPSLKDPVLDSNLFDAILHGGSLVAICVYFRKRIIEMFKDMIIFKGIAISCIPVLLIGFFIAPYKETVLRSPLLCAVSLVVFGFFMIYAENKGTQKLYIKHLSAKEYLYLGLMQALALIPGVSRSGVTISTGLMLNMKRKDAMDTAFLMAVPTITAAFLYKLKDVFTANVHIPASTLATGLLSSAVFSFIALLILDVIIKNFKFSSFAYYRFLLAMATIVVIYLI